MTRTSRLSILFALGTAACGRAGGGDAQSAPPPAEEAPVAINPEVPVAYPPALFDRGVDGEVKLKLFADSTGKLVPESTKILESSGYPAMDSAAMAGAPKLRFAPGRRHGLPVATAFQQAIEFRHPSSSPITPAGDAGEAKPLPPPVTLSTPVPAAPKPKPRPRPRPAPTDTARTDSTRTDSARRDTTQRDTTQRDTTKAKPDTTPVKPDSNPRPVRPDSNDRAH
jgi:TonB family protein